MPATLQASLSPRHLPPRIEEDGFRNKPMLGVGTASEIFDAGEITVQGLRLNILHLTPL